MNHGVDIGKIEKLRGDKDINWSKRIIKFCRDYKGNFLILLIEMTIEWNGFDELFNNKIIDWVK
jgi:hypothetical protein